MRRICTKCGITRKSDIFSSLYLSIDITLNFKNLQTVLFNNKKVKQKRISGEAYDMIKQNNINREAEKRNQFSFVCIFLKTETGEFLRTLRKV